MLKWEYAALHMYYVYVLNMTKYNDKKTKIHDCQADSEGRGVMASAPPPPNRWIIMLHNLFKVGKSIGLSMKDIFFGSLPLQ